MRISEEIPKKFIEQNNELMTIIESYGLKKELIWKEAKFKRATFYNKLKAKNFTGEEMLRIAKVINR